MPQWNGCSNNEVIPGNFRNLSMEKFLRYIWTGWLIGLSGMTVNAQDSLPDSKPLNYFEDYYPAIHRAEEAGLYGDFSESVRSYGEAFSACPGWAMDYFAAAEAATRAGSDDTAFKWIRLAARHGVPLNYFRKSSAFKIYRKTPEWLKFLRDYSGLYRAHINDLDLKLRAEITEMVNADQAIRKRRKAKYDYEAIEAQDSAHLGRLIRMTQTKGFPGERVIGDFWVDENENASSDILFQHAVFVDSATTISLLENAVRRGDAPPLLLGFTLDLLRVMRGDPQHYGTFTLKRKRVYPLEDEKNIDSIRASIGLEPFEIFLIRNDLDYFFIEPEAE